MIIPVIFPSAVCFWLNYHPESDNDLYLFSERERTADPPDYFEIAVNKEKISYISELTGGFLPVYVMSPKSKRMFYNSKTIKSVTNPKNLPDGGFIRISSDIFVASPELCFLQAAAVLSKEELLLLGNDLCGKYVYDINSEFHQRGRVPVTSVKKIREFLQRAGNNNGFRNALYVSKYLSDNANSRMESMLAIIGQLPASAGGYAVPPPEMNKLIVFSEEGKKIMNGRSCYGDMIWENEKVIVEYDSDLTHLSSDQHFKDKQRASAISISGYTLFTITRRNVCSISELDKTFKTIRHILGMRSIDSKLNKYYSKRAELIKVFRKFQSNDPATYSCFKKTV